MTRPQREHDLGGREEDRDPFAAGEELDPRVGLTAVGFEARRDPAVGHRRGVWGQSARGGQPADDGPED